MGQDPKLCLSWLAPFAAALLAGCGVTGDHVPYDPKHSAADRYGKPSWVVQGAFYPGLCANLGGDWSQSTGCQGFLWRDVLPRKQS